MEAIFKDDMENFFFLNKNNYHTNEFNKCVARVFTDIQVISTRIFV